MFGSSEIDLSCAKLQLIIFDRLQYWEIYQFFWADIWFQCVLLWDVSVYVSHFSLRLILFVILAILVKNVSTLKPSYLSHFVSKSRVIVHFWRSFWWAFNPGGPLQKIVFYKGDTGPKRLGSFQRILRN